MKYKNEIIRSMNYLASFKNTLFIGQSVKYSGNAIFNTLKDIPNRKKIELPVFEEVQMGISTGMALLGFVPISCYPRFDFLLLSMNQLVNHLDKIRNMSNNSFKPKVIIRTSIGAKKPLDGGVQHTQDHSKFLKNILTEIEVVVLKNPKTIFKEYKRAYQRRDNKSTLIVEYGDYYND